MFKKLLLIAATLVAVLTVSACKKEEVVEVPNAAPTITAPDSMEYESGAEFNPLAGVTATDAEDGDLTASITADVDDVNLLVDGVYTVELRVEDSEGAWAKHTITVTSLPLATYADGVDLSKLPGLQKGNLFAALENYLLDNQYGGIPLYTNATRVMYSSRTQLFSPSYNPVMGYGVAFSEFTADDSTVFLNGSEKGNAGEYTYRASFNTDPTSLNPWNADDSNTGTFTDHIKGSLYEFFFDEAKTGFEILPSLAKALPVAVGGEVINGKTYAKVWQIEMNDDLQWAFHADTDEAALAAINADYADLDASDYLYTWELAMTNGWFRAKSGGGDFISKGIKNAAEFLDGTGTFADVGLRMAEGTTNTIELEFVSAKSAFDVLYGFAGATLTPINEELYVASGGTSEVAEENLYASEPKYVASSGLYILDTWDAGAVLSYSKNTVHPDAAMYHYTGYQYRFVDGSDAIFAEFEAGRLDNASVPASRVVEFADDPRVKVAPDAATWRLNINAFGTTEARDEYIKDNPSMGIKEDFVPEPILSYLEMRQALYFGFDRYDAAVNVVKTYLPAYTLFADTYMIDAESQLSVRDYPAGIKTLEDFGKDSYGYYPNASTALFKAAVAKGIADGYYEAGTEASPTIIELTLEWASSGNTGAQAMIAELEKQYEELLFDNVNYVGVDVIVNDGTHPNQYYDYMMVGNCDFGIGAISGSLLDAPSFLDVFNDNGAGGFTLNWGIDTHTANIPVTFINLEGVEVTEVWSYNALVAALQGNVYIKDGNEQVAWDDADSLIDAYLDMGGEAKDSVVDVAVAEFILGDTLVNVAAANGFDSLVATTVLTESGNSILFVVAVSGDEYTLYNQYTLALDAASAIMGHSGYPIASAVLLTTDAEVAANEYLSGLGYATLAGIIADAGTPADITEIYATDFIDWEDGYVVLHVGIYYIGVLWL